MCDSIDVGKFNIEINMGPFPKFLAIASIRMAEMKIKGFIIAEGPDRDTKQMNIYLTPPKGDRNRFGKRTPYFWLEGGKWEELEARVLAEYGKLVHQEKELLKQGKKTIDPNIEKWKDHQAEILNT